MNKDKLFLKTGILKEIFNIAPKRFREKDLDQHYLSKKFHISGRELKENIDFLVETGLIQRFPGKDYKETRTFDWFITEKGLAHLEEREREKTQSKFNEIVAFTGTLIALITIYDFIIKSTNLESYPTNYWIITIVFLILVVTCLGPLVMIIFNFWRGLINTR